MAPWLRPQANAHTPLLQPTSQDLPVPAVAPAVQDHPIFLRVCHSPWRRLSQTKLIHVRGFILAYLTALAGLLLGFRLKQKEGEHRGGVAILFTFSFASFVLLWIYHAIAFSWTFTHLYHPGIDDGGNR
ncbi:hypothetical protein P8C59_000521 [Phyllachora maydis]|uniref:Uncharacterized protein n=1 Tax=Phyllachora maydis TaxID=1825666 RepID=A0AAD9HWI1_9PEZI|nr:hypothetical protein P8C59_000521 [Phyllachora maydis]